MAGTAFAAACTSSPSADAHYYGIALWGSAPQNKGPYTDLYISKGSAADWASGGFIEQTLWEGPSNSPSGSYWVEAGYTYGWEGKNILTYYRADNRPNGGGYHEHQITSITPTVGTWEPIEITYVGNNQWNVYYNFTLQKDPNGYNSISTNNPPYSEYMSTGSEATSSSSTLASALASAYSSGMEYYTISGTWTSSWGTGTGLVCNSPASVGWVPTDKEIDDAQS